MGCGGSRAEGRRGPGNTLASVLDARLDATEKECDRKEAKRDGEKEAQGEKSVNLMGTFMGELGGSQTAPPHLTNHSPADRHQSDVRALLPQSEQQMCRSSVIHTAADWI